jgi:hypothetical protein
LKSVEPELVAGKHKEGDAPSKEVTAQRGDVDKATPHEPINAAKQGMERDRGQKFTSATGASVVAPGNIDNRKFMNWRISCPLTIQKMTWRIIQLGLRV